MESLRYEISPGLDARAELGDTDSHSRGIANFPGAIKYLQDGFVLGQQQDYLIQVPVDVVVAGLDNILFSLLVSQAFPGYFF